MYIVDMIIFSIVLSDRDGSAGGVERSKEHSTAISRSDNYGCVRFISYDTVHVFVLQTSSP